MTANALKWLANVGARAAALSPRERAFVALFAGVLGVVGASQAFIVVSDARDGAIAAQSDWRTIEQRSRAFRTPAFIDAAGLAARAVRHASMGGDTVHIARARLQSEVERLAAIAGLQNVQTNLQPRSLAKGDAGAAAPVEAIVIELDSDYDRQAFARFVGALAASDQSIVPVAVRVIRAGNSAGNHAGNHAGDGAALTMQIQGYVLASEPDA